MCENLVKCPYIFILIKQVYLNEHGNVLLTLSIILVHFPVIELGFMDAMCSICALAT